MLSGKTAVLRTNPTRFFLIFKSRNFALQIRGIKN